MGGSLKLYLPKDEIERDVCFESDLPRRLCAFLGLDDPGASGVIGSVFRKDNPAVIDRILEKAGVGEVDCDFAALDEEPGASEFESEIESEVEPEVESDVETPDKAIGNVRLSTLSPGARRYTPSSRARQGERQFEIEKVEDVGSKSVSNLIYQEAEGKAQETAYKRILENVIDAARRRAHPDAFEPTGFSVWDSASTEELSQESIREAFPTRTQERDFKVGAAGELYMYEYLKRLGLTHFDWNNWKSGLKGRVKIHAAYRDLTIDYDGAAIADIEYLDESRGLTRFLIKKGHLAQRLWDDERPLYHIEVKTTTSSNWQETFYMSKHQEQHVRSSVLQACNCLLGVRVNKSV